MDRTTAFMLSECSTELPTNFQTWMDFYRFIEKDWNRRDEIIYLASLAKSNDDFVKTSKYSIMYIKSKCFDEKESTPSPDFTFDELREIHTMIKMSFSFSYEFLANKVVEMMRLKHRQEHGH